MDENEKDDAMRAARLLMAEALTLQEEMGGPVTVAALLACAGSVAADCGVSPRAYAEMVLRSVEIAFPEALEAAEDWRP